MSRKRKEQRKPQRLTDFYEMKQHDGRQDGAGSSSTPANKSTTILPMANRHNHNISIHKSPQQYSPSPPSGSPAKARPRMDGGGFADTASPTSDSGDDTRELPDSIESFPTSHQPVIDTVLKDMLLSLRSSLQSDLMKCMHKFNNNLQAVETRVEHIEQKMGEYATTINELVDSHEEREGDTEWIKEKIADIEDRNRRNNLKIRGIPETVQQADLRTYVSSLFRSLLPDLSDMEITIDRVHRLPKPSYLSEHIPRDVILRLHFYQAKEQLMMVMRKKEHIPAQYQHLQFYADLSQYTLQKRKNLNTFTKVLRNHNITYRWGYPTKLSVTREGHTHVVNSLEKGLSLLEEWNILPAPEPTTPKPVDPVWKTVTTKNAKSHS